MTNRRHEKAANTKHGQSASATTESSKFGMCELAQRNRSGIRRITPIQRQAAPHGRPNRPGANRLRQQEIGEPWRTKRAMGPAEQ
jgi:hypothetical protein